MVVKWNRGWYPVCGNCGHVFLNGIEIEQYFEPVGVGRNALPVVTRLTKFTPPVCPECRQQIESVQIN